jgi:hypothetical protein
MFSRRPHKSINLNEISDARQTNLEQNVFHSRIKQSNFKLLSLSHLKKKTLGSFLFKFKAVNVKGGVGNKFKKYSSLPLDADKTKKQKILAAQNLANNSKNLATSESNICETNVESFKSTIVNLITLNQNDDQSSLVESNSILKYLLKYNSFKENNKEEEQSENENDSNEEINLSTVIHSDSSGTEEENQTFVVLTDSDNDELPKYTCKRILQ